MAFVQPDMSIDMTTATGRREQLKNLLAARAADGETPQGDIEVLEPEFVDYTEEGEYIVKIPIRKWQVNGLDNVQGGILGYMMDMVFGSMSFVTSGCKPVGTMDMTANYLRPIVAADKEVMVHARVITNSKRVMHATAELYNSKGKVAVTASTNIMKTGAEPVVREK